MNIINNIISLETLDEETIRGILIITGILILFLIIAKTVFKDKIIEKEGTIYNIITGFERMIGSIIAIILTLNLISIIYYFVL